MKRQKTVCKNKPHDWQSVKRKIELWPYEIEKFQQCARCGKKRKGVVLVAN